MKNIAKKIVLLLLRYILGVKKNEAFQFDNQKSNAYYYFNDDCIMKYWLGSDGKSSVSLNWLLDDECKIIRKGVIE